MPCNCQPARGAPTTRQTQAPAAKAKPPAFISVRYSGPTSTTATAVSGRRYEFKRTGVVMRVDARDAASLATVPHLRRV